MCVWFACYSLFTVSFIIISVFFIFIMKKKCIFKQWGKQKNYCFSLSILHSYWNGLFFIYRFLHYNKSFFHLFASEKNEYWITRKNIELSVFSILHSYRDRLFIISLIIIIVYLFISFRKKRILNNEKENRHCLFFRFFSIIINNTFIVSFIIIIVYLFISFRKKSVFTP